MSSSSSLCTFLLVFLPIIFFAIIASAIKAYSARRVAQYPALYQQRYYQSNQQPYYQYQAAQPYQQQPYQQPYQAQQQTVIIKEIVKVPCKYCNCLIPQESINCPFCGAPTSR